MKPRNAVRTLSICCVLASTACSDDGPLIPASPEPLVYLVLNQTTTIGVGNAGVQRAILLTAGSPANSQYRSAEKFDMTRVRDAAHFRWTGNARQGRFDAFKYDTRFGNFELAATSHGPDLGTDEIVSDEQYELEILTNGVTIRGATTVPASFTLRVEVRGNDRLLVWPRVAGAERYSVILPGLPVQGGQQYQRDTSLLIPRLTGTGVDATVVAMDANLARFVDGSARSGINTGFGVFGAVSVATIHLAPDF